MKIGSSYLSTRIAYCALRSLFILRNTQYAIRNKSHLSLSALVLSIFFLLAVTACTSTASAEPTPPTIHYGEDMCEFCGMIISDESYAAGYITQDGQQHIFDDIGDMLQAHLTHQDEVMAFFVHNSENKAWTRAETATYVQHNETSTPMLSGLSAFDSAEKASTVAAEMQGQVLTFDELLAHYKTNPLPFSEHGMEHDH